ncbi:Fur family transcriptional regulator [Microbacterium sp. YJN-G]|uniref:Fur family transcriptional regulator n=1 Tax=Microbacterium sp. YJN-G TaxID=2763257 RepID=UPI001877ABBA|nr:Fur family transcriptional regulator [Microbacterium sp. YJN-G]
MTIAAPDEAPTRLRAAGLRVTVQRVAVLNTLSTRPHASADTVHSALRETLSGVALPTVHGILGDLTAAGLVRRVSLPDAPSALYEVQHEFDNHHHLQCVECGRVEDVACAVGAAPCLHPSHDHGMRIIEASVTYRAICSDCERNK